MVLKVLGVALLCILSIALLLTVIVPAAALMLGLGIDIPVWARAGRVFPLYSHPRVALLIGILLLLFSCWGMMRLVRL
jgi:hypothetical protein